MLVYAVQALQIGQIIVTNFKPSFKWDTHFKRMVLSASGWNWTHLQK